VACSAAAVSLPWQAVRKQGQGTLEGTESCRRHLVQGICILKAFLHQESKLLAEQMGKPALMLLRGD
jgi:hypothetical protein